MNIPLNHHFPMVLPEVFKTTWHQTTSPDSAGSGAVDSIAQGYFDNILRVALQPVIQGDLRSPGRVGKKIFKM